MKLPDKIKTIDKFIETTTTISKSRFIAQAYPINSETEVKEYLVEVKKKYFDASHHCYAFKLANGIARYSDAGEPNGTAGIRILNAIEHFELANQLIIVSRIFGGIKLGAGPLGKAYYTSAVNVLNNSKIIIKQLFQKAILSTQIELTSTIHKVLNTHNSVILTSDYQERLTILCLLKQSEIEKILQKLLETTKNKISISTYPEFFYQ